MQKKVTIIATLVLLSFGCTKEGVKDINNSSYESFNAVAKKYNFNINPKFTGQLQSKYINSISWEKLIENRLKTKKRSARGSENTIIESLPSSGGYGPGAGIVKITVFDSHNSSFWVITSGINVPIMDALELEGFHLPICERAGASSTCVAKLVSGTVDQFDQTFLTDDQIQAGYILPCVAYPITDITIVLNQEEFLTPSIGNEFGGGSGGSGGGNIPTYNDYASPSFIWSFTEDDGTLFTDPEPLEEPDFQFDPVDNYETKYPRFTNMVKNLKVFVKSNPKVLSALQKYSGFSKQQILNHLTFGNGPTIKVEEMNNRFGFYNEYNGNKMLHIRASYVRGLEQSFLQSTQEATAFLLAVTILHEYVHLGTAANNISEGVYDFGYGFEKDAFNVIVDDDNAGTVVIKFSKYF